jgi:hypothetical protein
MHRVIELLGNRLRKRISACSRRLSKRDARRQCNRGAEQDGARYRPA